MVIQLLRVMAILTKAEKIMTINLHGIIIKATHRLFLENYRCLGADVKNACEARLKKNSKSP